MSYYEHTAGGTLAKVLSESDPTSYVGPVVMSYGGDIHISGTWVGTLALQRYWPTLNAWKSEKTWTANPTEAQTIDTNTTKMKWRVTFTAFTSGGAVVALQGR